MRLMEEFENTCREFPAFRAAVVEARDVAPDPGTRAQLDHLLNSLDKTYADFQKTFPAATEEVKKQFARAEAEAKQGQERLAKAKAALAEQQKAVAAAKAAAPAPTLEPPAAPPSLPQIAPIDLNVGLRLRDELLKRFAGRPNADTTFPDREIWEDWEGEGSN